jgi:hypothetical protein
MGAKGREALGPEGKQLFEIVVFYNVVLIQASGRLENLFMGLPHVLRTSAG